MRYGHRPSRVFHAAHGNYYQNPYFKKRPAAKKPAGFYYSLLLLGLTLVAWTYFLFASSVFQIIDWEITGIKKYKNQEISDSLKDFFKKPRFVFFKSSNIFLFDKRGFEKHLSDKFIFKSIAIKKYYPHKIIISLEEKQEKMAIYNNDKIFIVADDGTIIREKEGIAGLYDGLGTDNAGATGTNSGFIDIEKVIIDAKTKELPAYPIFCDAYFETKNLKIGDAYPAVKTLNIINAFIENTKSRTEVKIKLVGLYKNQVNPKIVIFTNNNWKIYLNNADDGVRQFYKFFVTYNDKIKDINKNKPLEYIDLRFGDRVYIK